MTKPYWEVCGFESPEAAADDTLLSIGRRYEKGCDHALSALATPDLMGAIKYFVNCEVILGSEDAE